MMRETKEHKKMENEHHMPMSDGELEKLMPPKAEMEKMMKKRGMPKNEHK